MDNSSNLVVAANGDLWFGINSELEKGTPWEQITFGANISSSPDCIVTEKTVAPPGCAAQSIDVLHIIAQTSEDGLIMVEGGCGNFETTFLGRY